MRPIFTANPPLCQPHQAIEGAARLGLKLKYGEYDLDDDGGGNGDVGSSDRFVLVLLAAKALS